MLLIWYHQLWTLKSQSSLLNVLVLVISLNHSVNYNMTFYTLFIQHGFVLLRHPKICIWAFDFDYLGTYLENIVDHKVPFIFSRVIFSLHDSFMREISAHPFYEFISMCQEIKSLPQQLSQPLRSFLRPSLVRPSGDENVLTQWLQIPI